VPGTIRYIEEFNDLIGNITHGLSARRTVYYFYCYYYYCCTISSFLDYSIQLDPLRKSVVNTEFMSDIQETVYVTIIKVKLSVLTTLHVGTPDS
jgi:hypothetical protein